MCIRDRYGIAWGAIGAAMDCYDTALRYAKAVSYTHLDVYKRKPKFKSNSDILNFKVYE